MANCCDPRGCDAFFGERFARRVAKRYRRRGLDRTAQRIVDFLAERGIEGATVLEIGGGVGEIQVELLKRGARRAVNLELSGAYEREARALLDEAGLADRVERRLGDIAVAPEAVERVDAGVLNRVVCCYPDYERLARRRGRPRRAPARLQLPAAEPDDEALRRRPEPRVPRHAPGVPHLRPPARADGGGPRRPRPAPRVRGEAGRL